ncbi:MAG: signal peptide peptidase SppA [Phycisphaerae bacterium]
MPTGQMPMPMLPPMGQAPAPMFMMPPPGMFPPGMFKPKRSAGRVFLTVMVSILLSGSIILNVYLGAALGISSGLGLSGGQQIIKTTLAEGDKSQKIAVVPVKGVILDGTSNKFDAAMTLVEKDDTIKALVLEIETPGGGVTPSDEMYKRVLRFRQNRPGVPVVVTMGQLATSGGYYVSCAATHVVAQPSTLTGNIGVLMPRYNVAKLAEKYGVEEVTITAPQKGFKNAGSMLSPVKPEETKYLQSLIDEMYANFKAVVVSGRGTKLVGKIDDIADGKVYTAKQALAAGLVDEIGYADDALRHAAKAAGLGKPMVVRYAPRPPSFLEALGGADAKSGAGGVTVNGVNVNVDAGFIEQLGTPRPMYMWRGQ